MKSVVIIPTYNEAEGIETLLDAVLHEAPDLDVLVVDDNSPDGTATLVECHPEHGRRIRLLNRPEKDGLGGAYRAGFRWALEADYDAVVQMDADLSHPPDMLPALLTALELHDVVIGSRYVPGGSVHHWSASRRAISWAGNRYVQMVLGLPVHDATAGFKAFRRDALLRIDALSSESNGYCFQIENTWRAARLGLRVTEVPIAFVDRVHGESKMSPAIAGEAVVRVLAWRWRELTGGTQVPALRTGGGGALA